MLISDILHRKGHEVVTIPSHATVETAARALVDNRIGALVVRDRRGAVAGIMSERDIVRGLARHGAAALELHVEDIMTREVVTCRPGDTVRDIMSLITIRRVRHVPVMDGDRLVGIVSIGDIVKSRLDEKEHEVAMLRDLTIARS